MVGIREKLVLIEGLADGGAWNATHLTENSSVVMLPSTKDQAFTMKNVPYSLLCN